jgi:hypothetical protein
MAQLFHFVFLDGEHAIVEKEWAAITSTYVISILLAIAAIILTIATLRIRKRVKKKYLSDMAILEDWNRATKLAYSGNEIDILIALDIIWAFSNPLVFAEIKPVVTLLVKHENENISNKAKTILEKQVNLFSSSITTV